MISSKRDKIVLIYHRLELGGIETLIVRLANMLSAEGIEVQVFARKGVLESNLAKSVKVTHFDKYSEIWKKHYRKCTSSTIIAFDPLTYMVMRRLQLKVFLKTGERLRGHGGIFHPRSLFWNGDPSLVRLIIKIVFKLSGDTQFFFMSEAVKESSRKGLNINKKIQNPIIKLPISLNKKATWLPKDDEMLNIVSIGRLVPFKAYNRSVPEIIFKLSNSGVNARWDIWGDGSDQSFIIDEIEKYNTKSKVTIHGNLDYSNMNETVLRSDLFIGMGTAALEAASLGVPTICCIDGVSDLCYGYLYEAPGDIIGEQSDNQHYKSLFDCIAEFKLKSFEERIVIGIQCRDAALRKSSGTSFQEITKAPIWPHSIFKEASSLLISSPYLFAVDARKLKFAFRALRCVL